MIKSKLAAVTIPLVLVGSFALAGCGTTNNTSTTSSNSSSSNSTSSTNNTTTSSTNTTGTGQSSKSTATSQTASVKLAPVRSSKAMGSAKLTLNTKTHELTVIVKLTGLVPNSIHPEHIHSGVVPHVGKVIYPLHNLVANKAGDATATTVIKNVKKIPSTGWVIDVHQGPNLKGANAVPIANGNVVLG